MKTEVFLREDGQFEEVSITGADKPKISESFTLKWQKLMNTAAEILDVKAALLMKIRKDVMEVLLSSENEANPYERGDSESLGHGLYCETVIGIDDELLIENALENEVWNDNPDVDLEMIAYYGLPIRWPDGETLGTICVLDNKSNQFEAKYRRLINIFQQVIEDDLEFLLQQNS